MFSSDCISSSAYATEQILNKLIPWVGLLAFSLVVPITVALLVVLFFLILSYRETIKEYPTAGGAYMVTRDNFGLLPAQVAGVALLTDYVLTVSVSTAAGTDALTSAVRSLAPYHVGIALAFVAILMFGNLKGVRESGKLFAAPTYFFIVMMLALITLGIVKWMGGSLHPQDVTHLHGTVKIGTHGVSDALLYGAGIFLVLKAFASGGAAVTGVEAISNGVTAFRRPEWLNARKTLVIMGATLGVLFLGLSVLSTKTHPIPYTSGSPTVISQIGRGVFGGGVGGHGLFYLLQAGTMLILVLAANTSFADFPRLASFHAGDHFMPKQLTKRGHRLVFSNGIIALAMASAVLLVVTGAKVDRLIPLYAIGVFTSFTMSQAGMAKHHKTRKEPGWRKGIVINGTGAVLSFIVDIVILVTKFTAGAWVVCALVPIMVYGLTRLNKQYEAEFAELEEDARKAAESPIRQRHVVLVLVDGLDLASARAIQYAAPSCRTSYAPCISWSTRCERPHCRRSGAASGSADSRWSSSTCPTDASRGPRSSCVPNSWPRATPRSPCCSHGSCISVRGTGCCTTGPPTPSPRRSTSCRTPTSRSCPTTSATPASGRSSPTPSGWPRTRHGASGQAGCRPHDALPRHRGADPPRGGPGGRHPDRRGHLPATGGVAGRIRSMRVQPWAGIATLECTVVDRSGGLLVVFLGRKQVAGIAPGARVVVEGMVGDHGGRLAILNPAYRILAGAEDSTAAHTDSNGH